MNGLENFLERRKIERRVKCLRSRPLKPKIFAQEKVNFSNVWEDGDTLCTIFGKLPQNSNILTIASSGDNALAFLTLNPKLVVAADLCYPQLASLELKIAAFRKLEYKELLSFLGITPASDRLKTYSSLRESMSEKARGYWDKNEEDISAGIIHCGENEKDVISHFKKEIVDCFLTPVQIKEISTMNSKAEQKAFFDKYRKSNLKFYYFIANCSHLIWESHSRKYRRRFENMNLYKSPFYHYLFTGNYSLDKLPRYLREENFAIIKERLDRISVFYGDICSINDTKFDGINLSDIFDYMSRKQYEENYSKILTIANKNALLIHMEHYTKYGGPASFKKDITYHLDWAKELVEEDVVNYHTLHIEQYAKE